MTTEVETPLSTPEMSLNDYADLKETVGLIVHDYMTLNVKHCMQPKFHKTALGDITEMLGYILDSISKEYDVTAELLQSLIKDSMNVFYTYIAPRRSSGTTFIRIKQSEKQKKTLKEKIDYLQSIPQPDQRTSEWYEFRYKHLYHINFIFMLQVILRLRRLRILLLQPHSQHHRPDPHTPWVVVVKILFF